MTPATSPHVDSVSAVQGSITSMRVRPELSFPSLSNSLVTGSHASAAGIRPVGERLTAYRPQSAPRIAAT
jgi:hypothetical protein